MPHHSRHVRRDDCLFGICPERADVHSARSSRKPSAPSSATSEAKSGASTLPPTTPLRKQAPLSARSSTKASDSSKRQLYGLMLEVLTTPRRPSTAARPADFDVAPSASELAKALQRDSALRVSSWPRHPVADDGTSSQRQSCLSATKQRQYSCPLLDELRSDGFVLKQMLRRREASPPTEDTTYANASDPKIVAACVEMIRKLQSRTRYRPSTNVNIQKVLSDFLGGALLASEEAAWDVFTTSVLPQKLEVDVHGSWKEVVEKLEAVDAASQVRVREMDAEKAELEGAWLEARERYTTELRDLQRAAVVDDETLEFLERRFLVLFDRHSSEHAQMKASRLREELLEKLQRNVKVVRGEIKSLQAAVEFAHARRDKAVAQRQDMLSASLEREEGIREDILSMLSEKRWLQERIQSVKIRHEEEETRWSSISMEVEALKRQINDPAPIKAGPHMTPRPQWVEKLDTISSFRLPTPKQVHQRSISIDATALSSPTSTLARRETSFTESLTRNPTHRRESSAKSPLEHLRRATNAMVSMSLMRKRSGALGSFVSSRSSLGISSESVGDVSGTLQTASLSVSFVEFSLRVRERLAAQQELLKLAQEEVAKFRREHQGHVDIVASACGITVATAGTMLPKQCATAVTALGTLGVQVPQPRWSDHEVMQRCLALWAAALDKVVSEHQHMLPQSVVLDADYFKELLGRPMSNTNARLHSLTTGTGRQSAVVGSTEGFAKEPTRPSIAAPQQRLSSASRGSRVSSLQPRLMSIEPGAHASLSTPANIRVPTTYLQAIDNELQLAQLLHVLEHQAESHHAAVSLYAPEVTVAASPRSAASPISSTGSPKHGSMVGAATSASPSRKSRTVQSLLGDAVAPLWFLGPDLDTGTPLNRAAVTCAMALLAGEVPVRLLEDLGEFFSDLESALEAARKEHDDAYGSAQTLSTVDGDRSACVPVQVFASVLRSVCDRYALGPQTLAELTASVYRCALGDGVPTLFGAPVVTATSTIDEASQEDCLPPFAPPVANASHLPASPARSGVSHASTDVLRTSVRGGARLGRLSDPSLMPSVSWLRAILLSAMSSTSVLIKVPRSAKHSVVAHDEPRSRAVSSAQGSPSDVDLAKPQRAYLSLCAIAPLWAPFLNAALKHFLLQQHQLLHAIAKTVIETCLPSSNVRGCFVVSSRGFEETLRTVVFHIDIPVFADMQSMMEFYAKFPPQVASLEGSLGRSGRRSSMSPARGTPAANSAVWKLQVPKLLEALIPCCDPVSGTVHFGRAPGSPRSAVVADPTPSPSPRRGSGSRVDSPRRSIDSPKSPSAPKLHEELTGGTPEPLPPTKDPLVLFLRHAQAQAEKLHSGRVAGSAFEDKYVWRPPNGGKGTAYDDYYDVEEVNGALSRLQLRQFFTR